MDDDRPPYWFERHPRLTLLAVVTVGLVLSVGALEVGLRVFRPLPELADVGDRSIRLRERMPNLDEVLVMGPAQVEATDRYVPRPIRLRTDADGFLEPSRVHADPDRTVLFLGGSTTECLWVQDSLRFPFLVGRKLEASLGLRVNALNGGRGGNHTVHSLHNFLAKGLPQEPDVVVLMHAVNDLTTFVWGGDYWLDASDRALVLPAPCMSAGCMMRTGLDGLAMATIPGIWRRATGFRPPPRPPDEALGLPDSAAAVALFRGALVSFVETARAWGVEPVLMTQMNRFVLPKPAAVPFETAVVEEGQGGLRYEDYRRLYHAFNEVTRDVAAERGVPLVDLAAEIPQEPRYVYDFVHLTDEGSALAAERIAAVLAGLPALAPDGERAAP